MDGFEDITTCMDSVPFGVRSGASCGLLFKPTMVRTDN